MSLNLTYLRSMNVDRCESSNGMDHQLQDWSALEWAGAAAGEMGEAANIAKKIKRLGVGARNKPADPKTLYELRQKLAKEIGDTVIYLDLLAAREGLLLEDCVRQAFNTTSAERGIHWIL